MFPRGVDTYLGVEPIDLRRGFDRLCSVVTERIVGRSHRGAVSVVFGRRRPAMKVFSLDDAGLCIFHDRLDAGTFKLALSVDGTSLTVVRSPSSPEPALDPSVAGERRHWWRWCSQTGMRLRREHRQREALELYVVCPGGQFVDASGEKRRFLASASGRHTADDDAVSAGLCDERIEPLEQPQQRIHRGRLAAVGRHGLRVDDRQERHRTMVTRAFEERLQEQCSSLTLRLVPHPV